MNPRRYALTRLVAASIGLMLAFLGIFGTVAPAQAIGAVYNPIVGSGSTWSANALQAWIRNVWANYQWKITYSESGSTQGRNDFRNGTADFGVSEIPYGIANSNEADQRPARGFAYMPIVAGGTAFMYNLQIGGKRVTNLRLSGENIAKIFTGVVTVWNDPSIQADNPQLALPATPIVPVVRSDGSGTSAQFSMWMRQEQPAHWDAYCGKVGRPMVNGHCGVTSNYPTVAGSAFVARSGANGVAGYVSQGHATGAITFVEYSYALNAKFPVVKMLNASGYYTEPKASNVAVGLLNARINSDTTSPDYLTQDLNGVYTNSDRRAYPLSSYSYIVLPTKVESNFTEDKGLTLAAFGTYFLCEGQQSAEVLGYSPLPVNLVRGARTQIQKVPGGDPARTFFDEAACKNPTLDPSDPNGNALAKNAPYPEECDKQGPIQCTRGTGGASETATDAGGGGNGAGTSVTTTAGGGEDAAAVGASVADGAVVDGAVGISVGTPILANGTPQAIPVSDIGIAPPVALLGVGVGVLIAAIVPPLVGKQRRRAETPSPSRGSPRLTR